MLPKSVLLLAGLLSWATAQTPPQNATPGTLVSFGLVSQEVSSPSAGDLRLLAERGGYALGGAVSSAAIPTGQAGGVTFTFLGLAANSSISIGLGTEPSISAVIGYCLNFDQGRQAAVVYESGREISNVSQTWTIPSTLEVAVSALGLVEYRIFGRTIYASQKNATQPLRVLAWLTGGPLEVSGITWTDGSAQTTSTSTTGTTSTATTSTATTSSITSTSSTATTSTSTSLTSTSSTSTSTTIPSPFPLGPVLAAVFLAVLLLVGGGVFVWRQNRIGGREVRLPPTQGVEMREA